ncbi:MAG TPA: hypothetical protein VFR35_16775 [Actinoplanes sp.]|nr:hypothetical protein [Actinoplanes sp.]
MPSPTFPGQNLVADGYQGRYQTAGTVLEDRRHVPQLCYVLASSNPPQCEGLDIDGWSWQQVAHESRAGTSWGLYLLIGTYDGERFRLTEPARPADPNTVPRQRPDVDFTSPCPPPPGGWAVVDRATATDAALIATIARASRSPGFAGAWIDQNGATGQHENHPAWIVLNVRVTGDLAAHEADLRRVWGGALSAPSNRSTSVRG